MGVKICTNQEAWDSWFASHGSEAPFTQSWEWGEILIAEGKEVERLAVYDGEEVVAQAQVVYSKLPFGWRYAFCPKGPVVSERLKTKDLRLDEAIVPYLKTKKCIFFRIEPSSLISNIQYPISKVVDINPRATTILDTTKSEEELLKVMHEKTRYNIRLAERKGLRIIPTASRDPAAAGKDYKILMDLMRATGKRDGFKLHDEEHYRQILVSDFSYQISAQLRTPNSDLSAEASAKAGLRTIATAIFVGFGATFTYLYGASDYEHRSLMAPYLVQWEGIKLGKELGFKKYDFFGIAPANESRIKNQESRSDQYEYDIQHQYAGVTRFKLGFGGVAHEDPGTFDLIISPGKYMVYQLVRRVKRLF